MKLRLPLLLVSALLACFQPSVMAAPYETSTVGSLETSSVGGTNYKVVTPYGSNAWNLSTSDLHIGRSKSTTFTINTGATLTAGGVFLYDGSTLKLSATLTTKSLTSSGGTINLLAKAILSSGSVGSSSRLSNINAVMTLDTSAKWKVLGNTTFSSVPTSKLVLGEHARPDSRVNHDSAMVSIGVKGSINESDKLTLTTYTVEGKGSVFIDKMGVWQAYGNTAVNRVDNLGALIIGDGTNPVVFTSAYSGGVGGTIDISKNATWEANGRGSFIEAGKVTVEGVWDMSNRNVAQGESQTFLTQGVELVGGSTIRMNLADSIQTEENRYGLTFTGTGSYNLELVYSTVYSSDYTLMKFAGVVDFSPLTLTKGADPRAELRTVLADDGSSTSLVWKYLSHYITYTNAAGEVKNRSKVWIFNENDPHGFATSNFDVVVNAYGVLSTTKATVFSSGTITVKDEGKNGGKWNIEGNDAVGLGGDMTVSIQNGGILTSSAILKIQGFQGAAASLTVTGASSLWTATNDVYIASVASGSGEVNISDGAKWTTSGAVWLSQNESGTVATDAVSTINLNNATWNSAEAVTGAEKSSINISSGSTWNASKGTSIGSLVNHGTWYAGGNSSITSSLTNTGNLHIGGFGLIGTISAKSATLSGGTLFFDYAVGAQDQLKVSDSLNLAGPITIDLGMKGWLGAEGADATSYTLISYQTGLSMIDPRNITLKGVWLASSRQTYSLDFSQAGEIRLLVTGQAARLTWNGADNDVWTLDSTTWISDPVTADNHFRNNDCVRFDGEKNLSLGGTVWVGLLSVTESSKITMNSESGQIISTLIQNDGLLTINGGAGHNLGVVENADTSTLTLNGVKNSEITSITGGGLILGKGSEVSITGAGSHFVTLSGEGVLTVKTSLTLDKANASTIKLVRDASIEIATLSGATLELQEGSAATIGTMSSGNLNIAGGVAKITKISGGHVVMDGGDVHIIDTLGGTKTSHASYVMNGGTLFVKKIENYTDFKLNGGKLELEDFSIPGGSLVISGGEAVVSGFIQDARPGETASITITGGKLTSTALLNIQKTTLSGGELIVGTIVGSKSPGFATEFNYEGGVLKFNLSLTPGGLPPVGGSTTSGLYSFLHDLGGGLGITGALGESLMTGDVFGAELVVNTGGGIGLLGKTFSISNLDNVDFNAIKLEGSILHKTEAGKSGTWSFGGLNFGYQFDGNKLVFDAYASEITKPPVVTPNPDGNGSTSVYEKVILKVGDSGISDNNLTASLAPSGDTPGEDAGLATEVQFGTGLEDVEHHGLKGTSLATYVVTETFDKNGVLDNTQYEKQKDAFGLYVSGTEVLKSADENEVALMGKAEGTDNVAIASINSATGASLTLDNVHINVTNDDGDFTSRIESTTIILKGDSLLSGVSSSNAIQMNNSTVQGSGTLENISFNGGKLCAGNSPGVMNLNNINAGAVAGSFGSASRMVFQAQICNFGSNVVLNGMNSDSSVTGNVSQFNITGDVVLGSGTVFEIVLWNDGNVGNLDMTTLESGAKFQFFTFNGGSIKGEFVGMLNAPVLADGLMWDISQLTTGGFAQVIWSSIADGSRVANTLWTSGQTVANISTEAVKHVGEAVTGKTTVWLSSLNDFTRANSSGSTTGYDFNTQGYSVGAQRGLEGGHVIGLAFGNSYGTHTPLQDSTHARAGKIKQDAVMGIVYGRVMLSKATATDKIWSIDAYAGYGEVSNKSDRTVNFDSSNAHAKWDDMVKTLGVQANYAKKLNEKTIVTPFAGLDFIHGEQDGFTEQSKSVKASYNNGAYYNLRASLGAGISHVVEFSNGMALIPSLSASYGYDICRMNPHTDVSEAAGNYRAYGVKPGRNSFQITPALSWKINKAWSASTNYTLRTRSGLTDQSVNASVSYTF